MLSEWAANSPKNKKKEKNQSLYAGHLSEVGPAPELMFTGVQYRSGAWHQIADRSACALGIGSSSVAA